mgnify:FL=1|tara:strand:- start:856 stop:2001 length:1146 start_codon:yes stop_codon:yes gene_type:complete
MIVYSTITDKINGYSFLLSLIQLQPIVHINCDQDIYNYIVNIKPNICNLLDITFNNCNDKVNCKEIDSNTLFVNNEFITIKECLRHQELYTKNLLLSLCIDFINNDGNFIINIPNQPHPNKNYNHKDDSFRELCYLLKNIKINRTNCNLVFLGNNKQILLYDIAKLDKIDLSTEDIKNTKCILMGNGSKEDEIKNLQMVGFKANPFIFWSRRPQILEKFIINKSKSYNERTINSIFIGNIENWVQAKHREDKKEWKDCIDFFHCINGFTHTFTQEEYLQKMADSKFGLSFEGYGKKCNRDIELMALGTVMLRVPTLNVDSYYEPLIEGIHYINITKKEEIKEIIGTITEEKWTYMSNECKKWYYRNCHSDNTMDIWFKSII